MPPPMKAAASWDRRHTARNVEAIIEGCAVLVAFIVGLVALNGMNESNRIIWRAVVRHRHPLTTDH